MMIKYAEFVTSAATPKDLKDFGAAEIAVAGRSNSGKSTFINFITGNGKLARTSKEPGRTRLINYFSINKGQFYFTDLPGYGYARVSDAEKEKWAVLIESYLKTAKNIKNVFLLLDIRRDPNEDDVLMINYLYHYAIPFTVIATKADKLSRSAQLNRKREIANALKLGEDNIIVTSALKKTGLFEVLKRIEEIL